MTRTSIEEKVQGGESVFIAGSIAAVIILVLITALLLMGDVVDPKIVNSNLVNKTIPSGSTAELKFTFSHLMDQKTVEAGFEIVPAEPGSFAWAGKMMVFAPAFAYMSNMAYTVTFKGAKDQFGKPLTPYVGVFTVAPGRASQ